MRLVVFALVLIVFPASAAPFPTLESGIAYRGMKKPSLELYLFEKHFFALILPAKTKSAQIFLTGFWRQSEDGSLLILSNINGFQYCCNISGDARHLYLNDGLPGQTKTQILEQITAVTPSLFRMIGILSSDESGKCTLQESSSGLNFSVLALPAKHIQGTQPLLIEAVVDYSDQGIRINKILSQTTHLPQSIALSRPFHSITKSVSWLLPKMSGIEKAACSFHLIKDTSGVAIISGPGLRLNVPFTANDDGSLTFKLSKTDQTMLDRLDMDALKKMLMVTSSWTLAGESLLLYGQNSNWLLSPILFGD